MKMAVTVGAIAFDLDDTLTDWWTGIGRAAAAVGGPRSGTGCAS